MRQKHTTAQPRGPCRRFLEPMLLGFATWHTTCVPMPIRLHCDFPGCGRSINAPLLSAGTGRFDLYAPPAVPLGSSGRGSQRALGVRRQAVDATARGHRSRRVGLKSSRYRGVTRSGIGEAGQQHVDKAMTHGVIGNQRKGFLELIGDQQNAAALVAAAALGEHVAERQLTRLNPYCKLLRVQEPLDVILASDEQRHQSTGEGDERVAVQWIPIRK